MKPTGRILTFAATVVLAVSCGGKSAGGSAPEPPELLRAVPSDALCVGLYNRLDKGLPQILDSTDILRTLDYGRLAHAKAAVAICDLGELSPLVIIEAGKHAQDTSAAVQSLMALADSSRLSKEYVTLGGHDVLVISPSETMMTVVRRHLSSESSVLDAPDFDRVLEALPGGDMLICRNRGIPKVFAGRLPQPFASRALPFMRDASEWTIFAGDRIVPVQPEAERYFCNFCASQPEAPSRLAQVLPDSVTFVLDIPIASAKQYRRSYEGWLDARVALEAYQRRHANLRKAAGINPSAWEEGVDIKEAAVVEKDGVRLNMLRTAGSAKQDGVAVNPYTGFARALYGEEFNPADSCMIRRGNWIISGPRAVLQNYQPATEKTRSWPSRARIALQTPELRVVWTNDNIKLWDSNR